MDFLGIGPGELVLILILALILFGPKRLPEIGRALGKSVREFRQISEEFTSQLRQELDADPGDAVAKPLTTGEQCGEPEQDDEKLEG